MAKKSERAELKKECPSCGLGVTEQAMVCEFCGWDFNEEDEWILQIEKLERDLMLEKQRYEPGTVNHMIESTLRSTVVDRVEPSTPMSEEAIEIEESIAEVEEVEVEEPPEVKPTPPPRKVREAPVVEMPPQEAPKVRRVRSVKEPEPVRAAPTVSEPVPEPARQRAVRRVRTEAKKPPAQEPEERPRAAETPTPETPVRRTRVVRKIKE
jgi:hypothetical protein